MDEHSAICNLQESDLINSVLIYQSIYTTDNTVLLLWTVATVAQVAQVEKTEKWKGHHIKFVTILPEL
jgi:hypothetical protein